jgi:Fic family protein
VLRGPLLYLSLYLKRNRDAYYEHLQAVRTDGAWEDRLRFFLEGVVKAPTAARQLSLSEPPVYAAIARLEEAGILREVTGRSRGKTYVYGEYMDILNEGTEL